MVAQNTKRTTRHTPTSQRSLFAPRLPSAADVSGPDTRCAISPIEKRRDGGTRYWCSAHRADATAKGGKPAKRCRGADRVSLADDQIEVLDLDKYRGGVALWGAVPAVYDTTRRPMDSGIHVHARLRPQAVKELDFTYRAVRLVGKRLPAEGILVNENDAIYYMVSSVFGFSMSFVPCTHCGWPHLDKDWFSVQPCRGIQRRVAMDSGRLWP